MLLRCFLLLLAGSAGATPQITWLQTDWPPHQIVSGPFQGQGTFDLLRQQLVVAMPQFSHNTRLVSLARLEQIFQQQMPRVCSVGSLYSEERGQSRLYSTPMAVGPAISIGFVQQRLLQHAAISNGAVDINLLALDSNLRGAFQPSRYYAPVIEQALQHPASNVSSHAFTSELNAAALLANGRVDYVLEYPERMRYYNQLLSQPVKLQHLMIRGATDTSVSYVTCTQSSDGEQIMAAVDAALQQLWLQPEYQLAMRRWLDDAAWQRITPDIEAIKQAYQGMQQ
uniref:Solute-binding protein family 3/N-terminal domain-containing protein n=1 Tax=Rheinheimera sp. BAL341 TaxID=1708203 RepID=A0A486XTL9_9GAMM